jgi:hypothetical protein
LLDIKQYTNLCNHYNNFSFAPLKKYQTYLELYGSGKDCGHLHAAYQNISPVALERQPDLILPSHHCH